MTLGRRLLTAGGQGGSFSPFWIGLQGSRGSIMTGTGYKAFPGMTLDADGRLHLVYRWGTAHNSGTGSSIDYKYSDDDGQTWSDPGSADTIVGPTSGTDDLRDPCILALASGRLLLGYDTRNPYTGSTIHAYTRYSDDNGASWSAATAVSSSYTYDVVTSQPIQLPGGDILLPAFGESGGDYEAFVMRSTDDGETFGDEVTIASGVRDYQEPQIRRLSDGRIVALMRSESNHHTWRSYSDDDGATWSSPTDVLDFTGRPDFVEIRSGCLLLVGRWNTTGDSPLYWTYSRDQGLTWADEAEVDASETALAMYCAPVVTSNGAVTMAYSLENSASDADIYLRRFIAS